MLSNLRNSFVNDTVEEPAIESIGAFFFTPFAVVEVNDDLPEPGNPSMVMLKSSI